MSNTIISKVIHGQALGRTLGFPTANIAVDDSLELSDGVYSARVKINNQTYQGIANLDHKPSINGEHPRGLEVHIFDFSADIYDQKIEIELQDFIREQRKFSSLEELQQTIKQDIKQLKIK